jgi:hypothetical protein
MSAKALGLAEVLGAYPFWAVNTGVICCAAGLLIYAGLRRARIGARLISVLSGFVLIRAVFAALQGDSVFVASFVENSVAGRFWYFGWHAMMAALCKTMCALSACALRR